MDTRWLTRIILVQSRPRDGISPEVGGNVAIAIPASGLKTHWYLTLSIHGLYLARTKSNLKIPPLGSSLEGIQLAEI